jgi:uncharacterized membrane protein YfcA
MKMDWILILIVVGVAAGMLSGLVGVGGGIIIVPALVLLLGFDQKTAQGTSLAMILLPTGIFGVWNYYQKGMVDIKAVLVLAAGFVIGAYFGSKLAISLPEDAVKKVFGVLLLLVAAKFLLGK